MKNNVRKLRKSLRLTQEALSHSAGTSQQTIHRIEREGHVPRLDIAERICKALGHTLDVVFPRLKELRPRREAPSQPPVGATDVDEDMASLINPAPEEFFFRLKNGIYGQFVVQGNDKQRLWQLAQRGSRKTFALFNTKNWIVGLNLSQLAACQFGGVPHHSFGEISVRDESGSNDCNVIVHFCDSATPVEFEVDPDSISSLEAESETDYRNSAVQYLYVQVDGAGYDEDDVFHFVESDEGNVLLHSDSVALIRSPRWIVEPDFIAEGEEAEKAT